MTNRQLVEQVMVKLGINPMLINEGAVPLDQTTEEGFKDKLREAMVLDMTEGLLAKTQHMDREENGEYYLRVEAIVFHPQEFLAFVDMLAGAFIERGRMQSLPQKMGIVT